MIWAVVIKRYDTALLITETINSWFLIIYWICRNLAMGIKCYLILLQIMQVHANLIGDRDGGSWSLLLCLIPKLTM